MAIARGAGTEIIRSHQFEELPGAANQKLLVGVQHHIYTVLSITTYCNALNTAGTDYIDVFITCYDSFGGTTGENIKIFKWKPGAVGDTYVWNDKFSFNGAEPANFTGPMDTVAEQDAIADQGTATAQGLSCYVSHASTNFDINLTFIDQNNA